MCVARVVFPTPPFSFRSVNVLIFFSLFCYNSLQTFILSHNVSEFISILKNISVHYKKSKIYSQITQKCDTLNEKDNSLGVIQLKNANRPPLDDEARERIERIKRERAVADEIADAMGETEDKPRNQIRNVVRFCGIEFAQEVYRDMLDIEANGGMLVLTGERRRTQGGVFFQLVRERIDQETRERIFVQWVYNQKQFVKKESMYEPFVYEDRIPILARLLANPGEVEEVNITLVGRHTEIERRQALVIVAMKMTVVDGFTMPVGVPYPPKETNFIVYISIRQWEKIEPLLQADSTDQLMVTGFCGYDEDLQAMVIYSTNATTRKTYKAEKQARQRALMQQNAPATDNKKPQKPANKGGDKPRGNQQQSRQSNPQSKYMSPPPPKNKAHNKPSSKPPVADKPPQPAPTPVVPAPEPTPDSVPSSIAETLRKLYSAAATYRQKIDDIRSKPQSQQFGLEMTEKLLASTEKQIAALEKQFKK